MMDAKLAEYRAQKRKEQFIKSSKEKLISLFKRMSANGIMEQTNTNEEKLEMDDQESVCSEGAESISETQCCDELTYAKFSIYVSLWLVLFSLAIYMEFGAVYFVISLLYIIWANTRTGPKRKGEVSAYSVFNPNCEAIDGTLKPEQFEKEIRYGVL